MNTKFAFYGTLRRGMENFALFEHGLRFLKITELQGFRMYSRGSYPYIVLSEQPTDKIVVELFEVFDVSVVPTIQELELNAGYFLKEILIDNEKFGIYVFGQNIIGDELITSGDWALYVAEKRF